MVWGKYHCVYGTSHLCTLSASAFIEPSLIATSANSFRNLFMEMHVHISYLHKLEYKCSNNGYLVGKWQLSIQLTIITLKM